MIGFRSLALSTLVLCAIGAARSDVAGADKPSPKGKPSPKFVEPRQPDAQILERWHRAGASHGWLREGRHLPDEPIRPDEPFGFQFPVFVPEKLADLPDLDEPFAIVFESTGRENPGEGPPRWDPAPKLAALRPLKHLAVLRIEGIGDAGLAALADLPQVRSLFLSGTYTDEGLKHLARLTSVTKLHLTYPALGAGFEVNVTDAGAKELARMQQLESLNLYSTHITDAGLAHLATLPKLRSLHLSHASITDDGLRTLWKSKTLEELELAGCKISDRGASILANYSNLRTLDLRANALTDASVESLARLPKLESLDLSANKITNAGLKTLEQFPQLQCLGLEDNKKITVRGLMQLAHLKHLKRLESFGPVTEWDWMTVSRVLRHLQLGQPQIIPAGIQNEGRVRFAPNPAPKGR
jgi:hypothetical protein